MGQALDQHVGHMSVPLSAWQQHAETAWTIDPRIALALLDRSAFPKTKTVHGTCKWHVQVMVLIRL